MISLQTMGVVNITPNSFSDGGRYLDPHHLKHLLKSQILDFGAESTAPMNDSISADEEKKRLEIIFDLDENTLLQKNLSLDSYRSETCFWFFEELKKRGIPNHHMIWNDVSGQWDDNVEKFLRDFEGARYIFCHSLVPRREESSHHMNYPLNCDDKDVVAQVQSFFKRCPERFKAHTLFDPCFGFSKSASQNWALMQGWSELISVHEHWVFGISKKSFLRKWWSDVIGEESREGLLQKSEYLHLLWLQKVIEQSKESKSLKTLFLRVHEPDLISLLKNFSNI